MIQPNIEATVDSVYSLLAKAERSVGFLGRSEHSEDDYFVSHDIVVPLNDAYSELLTLTEAMGLTRLNKQIKKSYQKAEEQEGGISANGHDPDGEKYLLCSWEIRRFNSSLETVFGLKKAGTIHKDLVEILRATQYSIIDENCFESPPASEADVHHRIEAVLRCVFPNLDHQPPVSKAIKNFRPDTGIPSLKTLIEYKFIQTKQDAKRIADEILADTRGYQSKDWDRFVFLIYETKRLRKEAEWNRLLRQCNTGKNVEAIVICGETAPAKKKPKRKTKKTT